MTMKILKNLLLRYNKNSENFGCNVYLEKKTIQGTFLFQDVFFLIFIQIYFTYLYTNIVHL